MDIFKFFSTRLRRRQFFQKCSEIFKEIARVSINEKKIIVPVIRLGLFFAAVSSREMLTVDSRIDKSWSVRASRGDTLCRVKRERESKDEKCVAYAFARETWEL